MKVRSLICIIVASICWGTSAIFFKLLTPYGFSPVQLTSMRGIISGAIIIGYALIARPSLFRVKPRELILFILSGTAVFFTAFLYYGSIKYSGVPTAVMLMYTAPVFVMGYSVAFLGERLTPSKFLCIILVVVGSALVSGITKGMSFNLIGFLLGLGSGIMYSAYNIITRIEMMRGSSSVRATLYNFITMGIISFVLGDVGSMIDIASQDWSKTIPLIIGIGICTCILPYFLYTLALRNIPAGTASAIGILEPIAATLFSLIFFDEKLDAYAVIGIICVLVSVVIISLIKEDKNKTVKRGACIND